jgi:hypothetical protein
MQAILAALLLSHVAVMSAPADTAETELIRALDRFYTWGDLVERFRCRVHGRWLDYEGATPRSGQFWGDVEYSGGGLSFVPVRTLGPELDPKTIVGDIHSLVEQAGLLPSGFPLPPGTVRRRTDVPATRALRFDVLRPDGDPTEPITFDVERNRVTAVSMPDGRRGARLRFDVRSQWIPGDRYLITQLVGRAGPTGTAPRIAYHYRYYAGQYFPRAITEDRNGRRLSLIFYWYEIDMKG